MLIKKNKNCAQDYFNCVSLVIFQYYKRITETNYSSYRHGMTLKAIYLL